MKNKIFAFAFMLIGTFALANIDSSVTEVKEELRCNSSTVTSTTSNTDGLQSSTTNTKVSCDTPKELAQYHVAMAQLGIER
jgi:hypothetical protein